MGSLNNGQKISQQHYTARHLGHQIQITQSTNDAEVSVVADTGTIRSIGENTIGVIFGGDGSQNAHTSGMPLSRREVDNSVEWQKYSADGTSSGNLEWQFTRKFSGIHTSISTLQAEGSLGPSTTTSERKVFFIDSDRTKASGYADWNIFDSDGIAVGAGAGTTDTDTTPSGSWDEQPRFDG